MMIKKDINRFRQSLALKRENLTIHELCHIYDVKQTKKIYYRQVMPFSLLEKDEQEMYIFNFQKILMGHIDQKLFPFRFEQRGHNEMQQFLYDSLTADRSIWEAKMTQFVEQLITQQTYEQDVVFTFARGEYVQASLQSGDIEFSSTNPFLLCTINETKMPDNELLFDYVEKEFTYYVEIG